MQINEQELAEAVDRLREGESVMGVTDDKILAKMLESKPFLTVLLSNHLCENNPQRKFEKKFNEIARYELREALRTHKEQQAGLM